MMTFDAFNKNSLFGYENFTTLTNAFGAIYGANNYM